MAINPKQAIERAVTLLFFMLLVIDVMKVVLIKQPQLTQEQKQQLNNTNSNNTLNNTDNSTYDQNSYNSTQNSENDTLRAEKEFEKFKENQDSTQQKQKDDADQKSQSYDEAYEKQKQKKIYGSFTNLAVVSISYCPSLLNNFQTLQQQIQSTFPTVDVVGTDYPISQENFLISKALTAVQYTGIAVSLFGDKIFAYLKMAPPSWYAKIQANKWTACLAFFFGGNVVGNYFTQTGAFEIYMNEKLIYSKLNTHKIPQQEEILNIIEKNLSDLATNQQYE